MSNTLVCLTNPLSYLAQDVIKSEISYNNPSIVNVPLKSKTDLTADYDMDDEENKKPESTVKETLQRPVASRKREASNALIECVKRRDFQQNCDKILHVPFQQSNQATPLLIVESYNYSTVSNDKAESEGCEHSTEIPNSDISDCASMSDSGIETLSKNSSPCHSTDTLSSQDDGFEECSSVNMDVDNFEPILGIPQDVSSVDCHNQGKSPTAIYEDLNCLHLTDETVLLQSDSVAKYPIAKSLFSNVASSIYFSLKDEKVAPMPSHILPFMKWKLSAITPIIVKDMVLRVGFSMLNANTTEEWLGTWGKHLKCCSFKRIKNYQKVNHYPGSFNLGRKDKLWENYKRMQSRFGVDAYDFFPETFYLPNDLNLLKEAWGPPEVEKCWIIKPPASARGTGVKVISKWSQVPKNRRVIVQRYLSDPYLINGTKFDLRIYVLVTSIEPLRFYVYQDGLVRFASEKYSLSSKSFSNRFVHLTNYSINRKSTSYMASEDGQGHKWTLKTFWSYMANSGIDVEKIKESITDMIIKTVICAEGQMCRLMKTYARSTYNCFELFGFDIMLDKNLRPWLLEVNISPSLHTRSALDINVKSQMVKNMLNMAGYQVPEKKSVYSAAISPPYGILSQVANKHKALRNRYLSEEEKYKHSVYTFKYEKFDILANLTPDDVRCLVESEDEFDRKGGFQRIFPSCTSSQYFHYFEHIRYYNLLLDAWEKAYSDRRKEGIERLQELCDKKVHLQTHSKESFPDLLDAEPDIEITVH